MNKQLKLLEVFKKKNIKPIFFGKQLVQKKICMQKDIGVLNNLFGGNLLSWVDESAAGFVSEAIGFRPVVTVVNSIEEYYFFYQRDYILLCCGY